MITPFTECSLFFYVGDRVHTIEDRELQRQNKILTATLRVRETNFDYFYDDDYQYMISALVNDHERNSFIIDDVVSQVNTYNGIALVISDRKSHCQKLYRLIQAKGIEIRLLTGEIASGKRKAIVVELNKGQVKALVATSQLICEGFDLQSLSAIFITTPIKFTGRVKQAVGRIIRTAQGKDNAVIYDYVDLPGVLKASFRSRLYAYNGIGVTFNES